MWTDADQLEMELWQARWLVEHANELPDMSNVPVRRRKRFMLKFARVAWLEMRRLQKKEDREALRWQPKTRC